MSSAGEGAPLVVIDTPGKEASEDKLEGSAPPMSPTPRLQMEGMVVVMVLLTLLANAGIFGAAESWEETMLQIMDPDGGLFPKSNLVFLWLLVVVLSAIVFLVPYRYLEKRKAALATQILQENLDAEVTLQLQNEKFLLDFMTDAMNFSMMMPWDFALRETFPTDSLMGIWIYCAAILIFTVLVNLQKSKLDKKAEELATQSKWAKLAVRFLQFVLDNLTWLIALAMIAGVSQTFEAKGITEDTDVAIASYWLLSGVTLVAVFVGFFVDKLVFKGASVEEEPTNNSSVFSGVGFKRLFNTGSKTTAGVIFSALGVFFVELMQEAMELSLERDGYDLTHIIKFSLTVLMFGFFLLFMIEHLFGARSSLTFKRLPVLHKPSLWQSFQQFSLRTTARTCAYLGGYAIQMTACQWIAKVHADLTVGEGEYKAEQEAAKHEHQDTQPGLPHLMHQTRLGAEKMEHEQHRDETQQHATPGAETQAAASPPPNALQPPLAPGGPGGVAAAAGEIARSAAGPVAAAALLALKSSAQLGSMGTRHLLDFEAPSEDEGLEQAENSFSLTLTLALAAWAMVFSVITMVVTWLSRKFVVSYHKALSSHHSTGEALKADDLFEDDEEKEGEQEKEAS